VARRRCPERGRFAKLFLLVLLLLGVGSPPSSGLAASGPDLSLPQGGVLLVLFPWESTIRDVELGQTTGQVHPWISGKPSEGGGRFRAVLVGVDFAHPPGTVSLKLVGAGQTRTQSLSVTERPFQVSRLSVARSFVTPPASFLRRLARERAVIMKALAAPDVPLRFHAPFLLPLSGRVTHDFGAYRYLNGHPMARHSGEDIDAPKGTPVHAANDGVVRLAGRFYYDGNMVIVDHGGGLLTEYLHMSDMVVHAGDRVVRGEVLGHVGQTGRVTGPVLHYGAVLRGAHINPMLLTGLVGQAVHLPALAPGVQTASGGRPEGGAH